MVTRVLEEPAIMSLLWYLIIFSPVLLQIVGHLIAFLLRSAAKFADWPGSAPPLETGNTVTAESDESDTDTADNEN